jgi:hypothetical protein
LNSLWKLGFKTRTKNTNFNINWISTLKDLFRLWFNACICKVKLLLLKYCKNLIDFNFCWENSFNNKKWKLFLDFIIKIEKFHFDLLNVRGFNDQLWTWTAIFVSKLETWHPLAFDIQLYSNLTIEWNFHDSQQILGNLDFLHVKWMLKREDFVLKICYLQTNAQLLFVALCNLII